MRRSESFSLLRFVAKTCIMLAVVLVFPLYAVSSDGTWYMFSMSFFVSPPVFIALQTVDLFAAFQFAPPQVTAIGLAECVPGICFYYRLSSQNASKRMRRSLLLASGTTLFMGLLLPLTLPLQYFDMSMYFFSFVLFSFPVLVLATFVFVPAFGRESSLMMASSGPRPQKQGEAPVPTLATSKRTALTIGLVVTMTAVVLPYSIAVTNSFYYSQTACIGLLFTASLASYGGFYPVAQSFAFLINDFFHMLVLLIPLLPRLVFAKKLLNYCRGTGNGRRLLAMGLIAEAWAFLASLAVMWILAASSMSLTVPLPALFLTGLIIVRFRDSFTQPAKITEKEVWPLSYQEERPIPARQSLKAERGLNPEYELVKVPVAYVLVSRVRARRKRGDDTG